jgi:acetyl esterase/lipase
VALAAALAASAARAETAGPPRTVQYGPLTAEQADLYAPPASWGAGPHPALIMIHGGAWTTGHRGDDAGLSRFFADYGFVVLDIDYRLSVPGAPQSHWPAQLQDCRRAATWLKQHAEDLAIDPARVGAVGDSAGGTLAVLLGEPDGAERPYVAAVVDQFGVSDLGSLGRYGPALIAGLFGTGSPPADRLRSVSLFPAAAGSVPVLIVHGDQDEVVPLRQSQRLLQALTAAGVEAQLITYPGGHGFAGLDAGQMAALFTREADWLRQHLAP